MLIFIKLYMVWLVLNALNWKTEGLRPW